MYGLIAIVVIAAIAFFILQSKKKAPPSKASTAKKAIAPAAPTSNAAPKATEADIQNTIDKVNVLITDKEYERAESLLNFRLKQNSTSEPLYHKLLEVYHCQDNDLAVKQLLETVQSLHLNELYQKLYSDHEAYLAQRAADAPAKSDSIAWEGTPPSAETAQAASDNLSAFDDLGQDLSTTSNEPLDFNISLDTPATQTEALETSNTLEFNVDSTQAAPASEDNAPLAFKLDEPSESQSQPSSSTLEFSLEEPSQAAAPTDNTLAFKLDEPAQTTEETPSFNFSLEVPATDTPAPTQAVDLAESTLQTTVSQFADPSDPIVEFFPQLAEVDPIDLDLDLAEHYIRLGKKSAARQLIENQSQLSSEQSQKAAQLKQQLS